MVLFLVPERRLRLRRVYMWYAVFGWLICGVLVLCLGLVVGVLVVV